MGDRRGRVRQSDASHYVRAKLGITMPLGVSMFDVLERALEKDGLVKPDCLSAKEWARRNVKTIAAVGSAARFVAKKIRGKSKKVDVNPLASADFLQTYEWRKLRMEALKKHGARCQCCGASPATGAVMNVDHIKPRRIYPELALDIDNLQVLCSECNHGKGNWDMTDWRTEVSA